MPNIRNWIRSYKIIFGKPEHETSAYTFEGVVVGKLPPAIITVDAVTDPAGDVVSMSNLPSEGNDLRGFNFKLNTTRGSSSTGSSDEKSTLTLYNLNKETLDVLNQEGCVVRVYAGYEEDISLVYSGDILTVEPRTEGQDITYVVGCKDGAIDLKNTKVSIQYAESFSMANIVRDLASRFPSASLGTTALDSLESKYVTGGYTCQGTLSSVFDKICQKYELTYSRFNGRISVRPDQLIQGLPDYAIVNKNTYELSGDNIKTLEPTIKNNGKLTKQKNIKSGIQLTTYLIPISLDQFITIPSEANEKYTGTYKITSINFSLDSRNGPWDVSLKCEPM